jgi:hypothetical protein
MVCVREVKWNSLEIFSVLSWYHILSISFSNFDNDVCVNVRDRQPVTSYIFTKYDDIIIRFLIEGSEELSLQSSFCKSVVSIHWFILHVWPFGYSLLSIISKISTGDELKNKMKFCWLNFYGFQGTGTHWFNFYPTDNKTVNKIF